MSLFFHNMLNSIYHLLTIYIFLSFTSACKFKPPAFVSHCYCKDARGFGLHCGNITHEAVLTNAYSQLEDSQIAIFELVNGNLTAVPTNSDVLNTLTTIHISLSSLDSLFLGDPPTNLDTLVLEDVTFRNGVKWDAFKMLDNLQYLIIRYVNIPSLGTEFVKNVNNELKVLMFSNTNITTVSEHAFENFLHLKDLRIESAQVRKLKRSMFPRPAKYLELLSFEDNKIAFLPDDIFIEMPHLKNIDFSYNHITEIPTSMFGLSRNLELLSLEGNPVDCNCRISWFLFNGITWQEAFVRQIEGLCDTPENLNGVELRDLTPEDFEHCF